MLRSCVKTYSNVFSIYVIEYGIQVVLATTTKREEVEKLCKEFAPFHRKIYVENVFTAHQTYRFKL